MLKKFINSLHIFLGTPSLSQVEITESEYKSFYENILSLNKHSNLNAVIKVMHISKIVTIECEKENVPDKIEIGQVYYLDDDFVKAYLLILDIEEDDRHVTTCLCLPGKLPNGKQVETSLGAFTVFPSLQIYRAPEQMKRLSYILNINKINGVEIRRFRFVNDLKILKEAKAAPKKILNELKIKITNKNFHDIFLSYYFYVEEMHGASWSYLCGEDEDCDKYK